MTLGSPLSMQLYSARKFPPAPDQLSTIKQAGFTNVETFAPFYDDVAQTRRLLEEHGLTAKSGHFSLAVTESEPNRVLDMARALGIEIIVAPYLTPAERPTDAAGWVALGERLERARAFFTDHGLRFAWHNHDFEFASLTDGSYPIEHILRSNLLWEADVAWIVRGGGDPERWIERYCGRIPVVHVKDIAPAGEKADEDGWADVGAGVVNWRAIWPACVDAGAEIMIAEHDNPSDFGRFARASADAMRRYSGSGK